MHRILFSLAVLFFIEVSAQNNEVDTQFLVQKAYDHFYYNQDSAYYYFEKIKTNALEEDDWENVIIAHVSINRVASYHYNLQKMKSSIEALSQIFIDQKIQIDSLEQANVYKNSLQYDKGVYYFEINDYKSSKKAILNLIDTLENLPESDLSKEHLDLLSGSYNFIAKIYSDETKYIEAKRYYDKNIRLITSKKSNDLKALNQTFSLLAELLKRQKNHQLSNNYFLRALRYQLKNNGNTNSIVSVTENIIQNHLQLNQQDSASVYLKILKDNLTENHPFWYKFHNVESEIHAANNNYSNALKALNKSLLLIQNKWQNKPHPNVGSLYNLIGELHLQFNKPEDAIKSFDAALDQIKDTKAIINKTLILKILKNKALAYYSNQKQSNQKGIIKVVDKAVHIIDSLKPTFKSEADKLLLIENAFPIFESGIKAAFNSFQSSKDTSYIDKAFYYSEKSKNILLYEALLSSQASEFGEIPSALLDKESILKSQINRLEKKINKSKSQNLKSEDVLFNLKNDYRELIKHIETNYKEYYNLKYNSQVITIPEIQKLLKKEDLLLSYFFDSKSLYIISISNKKKHLRKFELDSKFNTSINDIYSMLSNPRSDISTLNKVSYLLYKEIIHPNLQGNSIKNLIIIPDGILNYLPFSSLVMENNKYLIEDYSIHYNNSATLFSQLFENKGINNKVLTFAPNFDISEYNELLPLPNNSHEATNILNYFDGESLLNDQASLGNFNSKSGDYGILHLATHAVLDDETPEYSYLAFQPSANNSNTILHTSDLYNLRLNAKLITLSACETGIGNLKRGEGFMSLAHGFYFAGASSISSTLWKINDASSLQIMDSFYKYLADGLSKDKALQKAKLDFLQVNSQNSLQHPYYWSGFVISGNNDALVSSSQLIWYLFGGFILMLIGVISKKITKN